MHPPPLPSGSGPTRRRRPRRLLLPAGALACGLLLLAACGGSVGTVSTNPPLPSGCGTYTTPVDGGGPTVTISGRIEYQRLVLSAGGLGPSLEARPARFVDVEVRLAGGAVCYGRTSTDASGDYSLTATPPANSQVEVAVHSRTTADPNHDITVHEADPPSSFNHSLNDVFCLVSAPFTAATGTVALTVPYTGGASDRPAIGFGVLDTAVTCWDRAVAALGTPLPAANIYTRLGNNAAVQNTSYYSTGTASIVLLGGAAGLPDDSDTDYFDDAVVAHEFMHFVDSAVSHSWTRGGAHGGGQALEPNFAWSEGLATGFGQLLLQDPRYTDTIGTGGGQVGLGLNVENVNSGDVNGIGGEFTVSEILWDLADDTTSAGDQDGDGVNVPLADLFSALTSFDPATDGPYLGLFLTRLVSLSSAISSGAMTTFLSGGNGSEDQQVSFPPAGADVFPTVISVGGSDGDTLDSTTGNRCRGLSSSHWYHLTLATGTTVTIDLAITPIAGSGDDLDLFLFTNQEVAVYPVASSVHTGATAEQIQVTLPAGTYVVRVEANCGGAGNHASYVLSVN